MVSFAIILLNTDLQASELHAHITSPRFVENTIEAVRTQLQQDTMTLNSPTSNDAPTLDPLPDIDELPLPHSPTTPPISRASSPPNVDRRSFTTRNRLSSIGSIPLVNRDSWVVALHPSEAGDHPLESNILEERWINDISRELTVCRRQFTTNMLHLLYLGNLQPYTGTSYSPDQARGNCDRHSDESIWTAQTR